MSVRRAARIAAWVVVPLTGAAHAAPLAAVPGELHATLRYRFEQVDDGFRPGGRPLADANASTLRTALSWRTPAVHGVSGLVELEDVARLGGGSFNDGSNGRTQFATVADPPGHELNQAYGEYAGWPGLRLRAGRQAITYRKAPLHRFIGTVLWRQNWQTFDAVSVRYTGLPGLTASYAWVWNVNRIFGPDAPDPLSDFSSDSHLVNVQYEGLPGGRLEAYAYLLDLDNAPAFSTDTLGLRWAGRGPAGAGWHGDYVLEAAWQTDAAGNPNDIDAWYGLVQAGVTVKASPLLDALTLRAAFERLSGSGGPDRFVTILGTNHAFQGWADRFLVTPGDGIDDRYLTAVARRGPVRLTAAWHDLVAVRDGYDYGSDLDLMATWRLTAKLMAGLKYARYEADRNARNVARNGPVAADVNKAWAWVQITL